MRTYTRTHTDLLTFSTYSMCFVTGCPVRREKYWTCCYQTESATEGDMLQIMFWIFFPFFFFFVQAFYLKVTNWFSWLFADFGIQGNWNPSGWDWEGKGGRGREKEAEKVQLKQLTKNFSLLHLDDSSIFANITLFKRIYPFIP